MRGHKRWREDRQAWELRVPRTPHPLTGERRTATRLVKGDEAAADLALAYLIVEVDQGQPVTGEGTTFGDLVERWLAMVERDLSPTTVRTYRQIIGRRIAPALGRVPLDRLGPDRLDDFYRALIDDGLAPASVQRVHAIVRRALAQATKWGWVESNVATRATPPKVRRNPPTLPPMTAVLGLLERAQEYDPAFGVLCRVAAATGMRRGELIGLRWSAVNLDQRSILVTANVVDVAGHLVEREPKWQSRRVLAIDDGTATALKTHEERVLRDAGPAGLRPAAFVWSLDSDGARPIRPDRLTARWRRLCRAAGVQCRFHDLRHLSATQLIAAGVDVRTVAGRLGHANPSTTLGIYSHVLQARDQVAAGVLGDLLDPTG